MTRGTSWPGRRFRLDVELLEERTVPTLLGHQLYPADHAWNQRITNAPVASNSDAIIGNIIENYNDGRIRPDFTQDYHGSDPLHNDLFGIPYNIVRGNTAQFVNVVIDDYPSESDIVPAPIPGNAVLENDYQDGPRFGVENRSDSHLLIYDVDNHIAYEFFRASRPTENADGKWHADQQTVWDMTSNAFRTIGNTSADAAGLSLLAGLVRPDEALPVEDGGQGVINHAIRVTMAGPIILDQFIYPASHRANAGNNNAAIQPPMGARLRLKADVDINNFYPQSRIIAQAMKDYGLIIADNGSNFFFSGASSSVDADNQVTLTWNNDDIHDWDFGLPSLTYADFEVLDLTPRVTDLDVHEGNIGTVVTITGQNFSGAAGHLTVFFGDNAATSVTYIDDSHLIAAAPAGAGAVQVHVQSGVPIDHSKNYTGAVFGYGVSATHANTQFTFPPPVDPGNTAPSVANAASAAPAFVTAFTTSLSVLGTDDAGESNLTYTWNVIGKPAGAADPGFEFNRTNGAKNTGVIFYQTGSYAFRVTISDAEGLTAASEVAVTVAPKLSYIFVVPFAKKVIIGGSLRFFAAAYDQYGVLLSQQPKFVWRVIGRGTITSLGKYTAPKTKGGPYTITARAGGILGTAKVTVVKSLARLARTALLP